MYILYILNMLWMCRGLGPIFRQLAGPWARMGAGLWTGAVGWAVGLWLGCGVDRCLVVGPPHRLGCEPRHGLDWAVLAQGPL